MAILAAWYVEAERASNAAFRGEMARAGTNAERIKISDKYNAHNAAIWAIYQQAEMVERQTLDEQRLKRHNRRALLSAEYRASE